MNIQMRRRNTGASIRTISEVVPGVRRPEHDDWIEFLRANDGAVPEVNEFDVGADNGSGVIRFYAVGEVKAARSQLADRMPVDLLPIADAEGGNYVCLGLSPRVAGVFFWDHETEDAIPISNSFTDFLGALRPFDPESVELKPGQVISAWIDPSLLGADEESERQGT